MQWVTIETKKSSDHVVAKPAAERSEAQKNIIDGE